MTLHLAVRSLLALTMFVLLHACPPANAESSIVIPITLCSKGNPNFPPQSGTLIEMNQNFYIVQLSGGEAEYRRADFEPCENPRPSRAVICPVGQARGPNDACTCPANQTMGPDGRCVTPPPTTVVQAPVPGEECKRFEDITVQGSSTVGLGVMPYLIQGFANATGLTVTRSDDDKNLTRIYQLRGPDRNASCFRITVRSTGSDTAIDGIVDRVAQIGMSSRVFTSDEIHVLGASAGLGPVDRSEIEQVVALDAVAVVVNKQNVVSSLSLCQIAQIFAGNIKQWSEIGGRNEPINLQVRTGTSGTFESFSSLVMKTCGVNLAAAPSHGSYVELLKAVESDAASIGFAPAALVHGQVKALKLRGRCGIEQESTPFGVKTEDYPLARRLFIFAPFQLEGRASQLLNYIKADERANDALSLSMPAGTDPASEVQQRAINQRIEAAPVGGSFTARETDADPASLRRFHGLTSHSQRLSVTFRFQFGSEVLDTKARQDVRRLALYVQNLNAPTNLLLAGFTDDVGSVEANVKLAARRAEAVRRELIALLGRHRAENLVADGFGKILPVTCNDTRLGQEKNRRVEVFLVP